MTLDLPSNAGPDRDAAILQRVQAGTYDPILWGTVTSDSNGHHGEFQVFADALKLDGVRIGAGAMLAQQVADSLGCLLLTPRLLDMMYTQASVIIPPFPLGTTNMMTTQRFIDHSNLIDAALVKAGYDGQGIVQTVGKPWMLDNHLLDAAHVGHSENYGWHVNSSMWKPSDPNHWNGIHLLPCVDIPQTDAKCIQPPSWAHGLDQADYSEVILLVARECVIDGQPMDLKQVLQDPVLAGLASHQGVMKVFRQPGVPEPFGPDVIVPAT
jgi:hypothetical protein